MSQHSFGRLLSGPREVLEASYRAFQEIPVDWDLGKGAPFPRRERATTLAEPISVTGPGTFHGSSRRTLTLHPSTRPGWRFDRTDLDDCLPVRVSPENVWTTGDIVSNIVLRSGPPQNYVRMVEHIIAFKLGTPVDRVLIGIDSGDPPLFDSGSLDLLEAIERGGIQELDEPVQYWTVKETVSICHPGGSILIIHPATSERPSLDLDCAVHFPNAIGTQRIRFPLNAENVRRGAQARTNTAYRKLLFCRTLGKLFADIRNLGYTRDNILIAGRNRYVNEPRLVHNDKSLEAVWHRSVLDLVAALALVEEGRFAGRVESYKAGHRLDVECIRRLVQDDLLIEI